jgi:hypothetical protein
VTAELIVVYAACRVEVGTEVQLRTTTGERGEVAVFARSPAFPSEYVVVAPPMPGFAGFDRRTVETIASSVATRLACNVGFLC